MHLTLRAGERVFINGAVLRVDRKVSVELLNDATFLLEGHVLQAEDATTPLRQLYFAAQTLLVEPAQAEAARHLCGAIAAGILWATAEPAIREGVEAAQALVAANRPFEALKIIRGLYAAEAALLGQASAVPAAATGPDRPPQDRPVEDRPRKPLPFRGRAAGAVAKAL